MIVDIDETEYGEQSLREAAETFGKRESEGLPEHLAQRVERAYVHGALFAREWYIDNETDIGKHR